MSVAEVHRVDAIAVRDGWAVLSIYQFEPWDTLEQPSELLDHKIATALAYVRSATFQARYHRLPVRIELSTSEPPDDEVLALCARRGVEVLR